MALAIELGGREGRYRSKAAGSDYMAKGGLGVILKPLPAFTIAWTRGIGCIWRSGGDWGGRSILKSFGRTVAQNNCFRCKVERKDSRKFEFERMFSVFTQSVQKIVLISNIYRILLVLPFSLFFKIRIEWISRRDALSKDYFWMLFSYTVFYFQQRAFCRFGMDH